MNPYKVLGVSENASDEEIKRAYRTLVKKHHPDRFGGDPRMAEEAAEKLKQINQAYDMVVKMRQGGGDTSSSYAGPELAQVRAAIARGDIATAEMLLDRIDYQSAEWHYLKGVVLLRRGWYEGAKQHFETAYGMSPGNTEYKNAYETMHQTAGEYRDYYGGETPAMNNLCTTCALCSLLSCCCNC